MATLLSVLAILVIIICFNLMIISLIRQYVNPKPITTKPRKK